MENSRRINIHQRQSCQINCKKSFNKQNKAHVDAKQEINVTIKIDKTK